MKAYFMMLPFILVSVSYLFGLVTEQEIAQLTGEEIYSEILYWIYTAVAIACTAISAFVILLGVYYHGSNFIFGLFTDWKKMLVEANVPEELHDEAIASFKEGKDSDNKVTPYSLTAPIVAAIFVPFMKWEAESVPKFFWQWDNNINPNGDNGVVYPGETRQVWHYGYGKLINLGHWQPLEDTPEARALCYWAEGHHPRSRWARWIWLGTRNRAKAYSQNLAKPVLPYDQTVRYGELNQSRELPGVQVRRNGTMWQMAVTRRLEVKYWPGKSIKLAWVQNFGYKLGIVDYDRDPEAMPVYVMSSIKRWLGD